MLTYTLIFLLLTTVSQKFRQGLGSHFGLRTSIPLYSDTGRSLLYVTGITNGQRGFLGSSALPERFMIENQRLVQLVDVLQPVIGVVDIPCLVRILQAVG